MKAILLVGGFGTRLHPLTLSIPKNLLPVAGVALVERVVAWLGSHGIKEVVLAMGYKPDTFTEAFPDGTAAGIPLHYAVEPEPLDTAGAIGFAARYAGIDSTFVVANGDVLCDIDVTAQIAFHRQARAEATIALTPVDDPSRYGVVPTDRQGRVQSFIEKPATGTAPTNLINAGTYVLEPAVLDRIPEGKRLSVERQVFPEMAAENVLFAMPQLCYWLDVGLPGTYLQGNRDLIDGTRMGPPVVGMDCVDGVWCHKPARVDGEIEGPSLIGDDVTVGAGAVVKGSVLGDGVAVAEGATVTDAVVLDGTHVGAGARVTGSVIGPRTAIGGGAVVEDLSVVGVEADVPPGAHLSGDRFPPGAGGG